MPSYNLRNLLLASSVMTIAVSAGANAQDTNAPVESVVVTGTRLTGGFTTPTPVTALGAAQLEARAPTTISDVVNQLPMMRQTTGNSQAPRGNGSGGQNQIDLRGLGTSRTLVLVDGKRFVPTNIDGTTDINLIPTIMIGRVDVVTGGASAAYGSDAVSGVVNFVIKDHINGVQGSIQYGESQRGDNIEPAFTLAAGHDFFNDRLHVVVGGGWSNNHGVGTMYSRPDYYGKEQGCLTSNGVSRAAGVPASSLVTNCTWATQAAGSLIVSGPLKGIAFGVGGKPYNFNYGTVNSTTMYGGLPNPEDPHGSPNGDWLLSAPHKRYAVLLKATYDLTDTTSLYFMYNLGHNEQTGLSTFHQEQNIEVPVCSAPDANPYFNATSLYNQACNVLGLTSITVGKQEEALGGYQFLQRETVTRETVGGKGALFGDWTWDAYYTHGQTPQRTPLLSNVLEGNYLASIYAVQGPNGVPVCGPIATNPNLQPGSIGAGRASQVQPGCVPFNIFGPTTNQVRGNGKSLSTAGIPDSILNNPTASLEAVNYIAHATQSGSYYQQDVVAANIHGTPFSTWAGPVSMAMGIEHRREGGRSYTDAFGAQNYSLSNNGSNYQGSFSVTEGYAEFGVPLASNLSWAQSLDLDVAVRETGYSLAGNRLTYKVGLNYTPNDWLRFRGTRSRDVREPSISELFRAQSLGIQASFFNPVTGLTGPEYTLSGGNPDLKPETAKSWTAGVVFTPHWDYLDGLNVSVDYYSVSIKGAIGSVSRSDVATYCATGLTFYCQFMDNNGPGGALRIRTQLQNLNLQHTDGFDFEVSYRAPLDALDLPGNLSIRWLTTFVNSLSTTTAISTIERAGSGVGGGMAKWVSNMDFTYALGPSLTNLQLRYTGDILADATLCGPTQGCYDPAASNSINLNQYPALIYVNLAEQYDLSEWLGTGVQLYANVNNLLDKSEPALGLVAFVTGGDPYDKVGRTYKAGIRFEF